MILLIKKIGLWGSWLGGFCVLLMVLNRISLWLYPNDYTIHWDLLIISIPLLVIWNIICMLIASNINNIVEIKKELEKLKK